jgi:hypothetical protein
LPFVVPFRRERVRPGAEAPTLVARDAVISGFGRGRGGASSAGPSVTGGSLPATDGPLASASNESFDPGWNPAMT